MTKLPIIGSRIAAQGWEIPKIGRQRTSVNLPHKLLDGLIPFSRLKL
jgi:hypothetical protein